MSEIENIEKAIAALEAQREILGDAVVDAALAPLRENLVNLQKQQSWGQRQRKQVTVLFSDISGFTPLSETMDPEEITEIIDGLWSVIDNAIVAHGGLIDKHIGDAVMALFGAPIAREDAPESAIRAGLDIKKAVFEYINSAKLKTPEGESLLKIRIGINTGLVLLGEVGTMDEYTAMGDTVNVANRMEAAAPINGILITHDTYRHVRGLFEVESFEPIKVKGKTEPIQAYIVHKARPSAFRVPTRGVVGIETQTIGREEELEYIKKAYHHVQSDGALTARFITILGEAGIGKSRLLYEFTNWLDQVPDQYILLKGRSNEDRINLPYSLIRNILTRQFEIQDSDSSEVAKQKLHDGILGLTGEAPDDLIPFIGHLIGFNYADHPALSGIINDAKQIAERAYHSFVELITIMAREVPVVIFLEDVHWGDEGSLDLVEYLAEKCSDSPLLVLCLARPILFERCSTWGKLKPIFETIELHPFSEELDRALVREILRYVPEIPEQLYTLVTSKAEGNPFYIEEIIKMLMEDNIIVHKADHWEIQIEKLEDVEVPATLTSLLQTRLDLLADIEREVLRCASIVGRVFWEDAIKYLFEKGAQVPDEVTEDTCASKLESLESKDLIFRQATSFFQDTQEYFFKNIILREVTYESVLLSLRKDFHKFVAEWLIQSAGDRVDEYAGRIGEHYELSDQNKLAADWYQRVGNQAKSTYAVEMAIRFYKKALELLTKEDLEVPEQRILLHENLGEVLRWCSQYEEALVHLNRMQELAKTLDDQDAIARSLAIISTTQIKQGKMRESIEAATEMENIARSQNFDSHLSKALFFKGWGYFRTGDIEQAMALAKESQRINENLDEYQPKAQTFNLLGVLSATMGNFKEGSNYFEQALEIRRAIGDLEGAMSLLNNLGVIAEMHSDYVTARDRYQEALASAHKFGQSDNIIIFKSNLGGALVGLGDFEAAEENLREAIATAMKAGRISDLPMTYSYLTEAVLGLGDPDQALLAAKKSIELAVEIESPEDIARAWRRLGVVSDTLGRSIEINDPQTSAPTEFTATQCFENSAQQFKEFGNPVSYARTIKAWAVHELSNGDFEKGEELRQEARAIFEELGISVEVNYLDNLQVK
jgi:class 3 adenylate cyclase/tetratricopeptide (TPR) repeat protein